MHENVLNGKEMRINGLLKIDYYVEDMSMAMEKSFEENDWLESVCDELLHEREMRWDLTDWREGKFKHTPEGLIEIGTYLSDLGYNLSVVSCDVDHIKYYEKEYNEDLRYVEDIGFYLTEMGMGLQGLGSLWRVVDPDMNYDIGAQMCR